MPVQSAHTKLSDGRYVAVREVDRRRDLAPLLAFLSSLPMEVRNTLPYDVRDPRILEARLAELDGAHHFRVVGEVDGLIVADATVDRDAFGWSRHIGMFRVVVHPTLELRGLRHILCERLIELARPAGVERLCAEVLADNDNEIRVLQRLGFGVEVRRRAYAKGLDGHLHDVAILSSDLESVWQQLEEHLEDMDAYFPGMAGRG